MEENKNVVENLEEVNLEDLKKACLDEIYLNKLTTKIKFYLKNKLYRKLNLEPNNYENYVANLKKLGLLKDYQIYETLDKNLVAIKALKADENIYSYEALEFINLNEEEYESLRKVKTHKHTWFLVCFILFLVLFFMGIFSFIYQFIDGLGQGANFLDAMVANFIFIGSGLIVGSGILALLLYLNKKDN